IFLLSPAQHACAGFGLGCTFCGRGSRSETAYPVRIEFVGPRDYGARIDRGIHRQRTRTGCAERLDIRECRKAARNRSTLTMPQKNGEIMNNLVQAALQQPADVLTVALEAGVLW